MPPYNPTSVYVPSPSETDKEARDMSIKRNLTVTNVSAQTLGVLGDLTTGGSLAANGTLTVPVVRYNGDPAPEVAPSAGLIKIDQTATSGRLYFSRLATAAATAAVTAADTATATNTTLTNANTAAEAGNLVNQAVQIYTPSAGTTDAADLAAVRVVALDAAGGDATEPINAALIAAITDNSVTTLSLAKSESTAAYDILTAAQAAAVQAASEANIADDLAKATAAGSFEWVAIN